MHLTYDPPRVTARAPHVRGPSLGRRAATMRTPHALLATTVTAAALAATVVAPAPAAAAPSPGAYYVQSATTGLNAADASGAVEQHRPRGDEDRQRWNLGADGTLENTD